MKWYAGAENIGGWVLSKRTCTLTVTVVERAGEPLSAMVTERAAVEPGIRAPATVSSPVEGAIEKELFSARL